MIGNRIYAPDAPTDQPFIVKGIDAVYGHFDGGDAMGMGATNFVNAARDLDSIQAAGYNLVRISVSAAHNPEELDEGVDILSRVLRAEGVL